MSSENDIKFNQFKAKASEQQNQLRIALLTMSVALLGYFAKDINNSLEFSKYPFLFTSVSISTISIICGLFAWHYSSECFYDLAKGEEKGRSHRLKVIFDWLLWLLLSSSVITAWLHICYERLPE